jgi:serum/glucocorticoid-regulated kinase 1/serum/glucocorticoid-regulated kinase 2
MAGGDLRYHIGRNRRFSEEQTSKYLKSSDSMNLTIFYHFAEFFIACMLLCLEYLHKNAILHRDIKPENLVFDENGYLRITDLGIARLWNPENSKDTSGTPGYMAPEVMCRQNHGVAVDYFAMGVIAYECMFGKRPYHGKDRKEIRDQILAKQVKIHP